MLITKSVGCIVLGIGKYQVDGVVVEVVQSVVIVGACNDNKTDLIGKQFAVDILPVLLLLKSAPRVFNVSKLSLRREKKLLVRSPMCHSARVTLY